MSILFIVGSSDRPLCGRAVQVRLPQPCKQKPSQQPAPCAPPIWSPRPHPVTSMGLPETPDLALGVSFLQQEDGAFSRDTALAVEGGRR